MENQYKKGSEWRKWDLHVHTPKSIYQKYGQDNEETWEKYIDALEELPKEFAVIGVNDYLFLDGYRKLKKEQDENNRIQNLKLFPVVEFRIDKFAGIEFKKLKRINLHVIFSNDLPIETIQSQFLNTLEQSYYLENGEKWQRAITVDSVSDLGKEIKSGVPPEQLHKYGSDLVEGFNNLNVKEEQVFKSLEKDCFKNKFLIAIGKTEWGDLKWTDASIATKKSIINKADIVFTAAESIDEFSKAKKQLQAQKVNDLLLDCSDAHYFTDSPEKDRLGNCNTWIKADPTFEGLKQIIIEPEERVFIGEEPEIFKRVKDNRTKYIKELSVNHTDGYNGNKGKWFKDVKIELNKELTAIIGNKGSGKSALSDITALCANVYNQDTFSFLHKNKFRKGGIAVNFEGEIIWESDTSSKYVLADNPEQGSVKNVKYLPQGDFENLTNEIDKAEAFQKEIEDVVFSHIGKEDRLGFDSFSDLINNQKRNADAGIEFITADIEDLNRAIIQLEKKLNPSYKAEINGKIKQKQEELKSLIEPEKVDNPNDNPETAEKNKEINDAINIIRERIKEKEEVLEKSRKSIETLSIEKNELNGILNSIKIREEELTSFKAEKKDALSKYQLNIDKLIHFQFDYTELDQLINIKEDEINKNNDAINGKGENVGLIKEIENEKSKLLEESKKMDAPQKAYQKYLTSKNEWEEKKKQIEGNKEAPDSLKYYQGIIEYIDNNLESDIKVKREERLKLVEQIFSKKKSIISIYDKAKKGIDAKITENKELLTAYAINIDASLVLQNNFRDKFLQFIKQNKMGSFHSKEGGSQRLQEIIEGKDFNNFDDISKILESITEALFLDKRENVSGDKSRYVENQVDEILDFYNYLFSLDYIDYNYQLKLGDKEIEQLSPGERGALLLIFYLLLDKNDIPLILDQPEDNLDNHSVANILVPFIKKAKTKRQIILVTHNPNLAVVADAEQIIWVNIEKEDKNKFIYDSGSIESKIINGHIVNVLEGAMPAFNKRKQKYYEQN